MQRVVIIGGGAAGLYAAWRLQDAAAVTLVEADTRLGGHACSVPVEGTHVDSAFIIFNTHTYPRFYAWLNALGVGASVQDADMSMTFFNREKDFFFAGRKGVSGIFAQPQNALRPWFWRLMGEMRRFKNEAYADVLSGAVGESSLREYLRARGYSPALGEHFLYPLVAAVWSVSGGDVADFSAATVLRFLGHHAILKAHGARWQTFAGGSITYVDAFARRFRGDVVLGRKVLRVERGVRGASVHLADGSSIVCDDVILATHADQALRMIADPTAQEAQLLGAWRYSTSRTIVHSDATLLPPKRSAWSSWNITTSGSERAITYDLVHLQKPNVTRDYFVSLGSERLLAAIDPALIVRENVFRHPIIDAASRATQRALAAQAGDRHTWFCGAYFGDGFHEDALAAAATVAERILAKSRAEAA